MFSVFRCWSLGKSDVGGLAPETAGAASVGVAPGLDDLGQATEGVVAVLVVNAVEDAVGESTVVAPDVTAVGDDFALAVGGDDGFRPAVVEMPVVDPPAVPKALPMQAERLGVIVIPNPGFAVDGDGGVAAEIVVGVGGFLNEGGWGSG
jgi:hypothetical protein